MTSLDGQGMTWGAWYWPLMLASAFLAFIGPEVYALVSGKPQNTLSAWVWKVLNIHANETPAQWNALDFLVFGVWVVIFLWLSFHFFEGRFT